MPAKSEPHRFAPRWPFASALALLCAWVFVLSLPMWTGAFLASSPFSDQYGTGWAYRHWAAEQWRTLGHVPLWNPEIFGGLPFVAAMHGDIFYPTAWLRLILPTTLAMNLGFAVHYVLAGLFVYLLLRLLGTTWSGAVVGGFAYQLSGVIGSYPSPGHDGKLFVTTLLPVALIGLVLGFKKGRYEGFGILAVAVGLGVLSPQHQMLYYMLVASGIFALYLAFGDETRPVPKVAMLKLGAALGAVTVGVGIGTIQLLPFFAYLPFSPRAEALGGYQVATSYSIPWSHVPEFFLSRFAGNTADGTYWGPNGLKLHSEYLGLATLGLAGLGVADRRRRASNAWLGGMGLLFLLVALGGSTPFYRLWWSVMPFMKQVRAPGMALYVVALVVAMFAAFGTERLERGGGKGAVRICLIVGGAIVALSLLGGVGAVAETLAQGIEMELGRPATAAVRAAQDAIRFGALSSGIALIGVSAVAWVFLRGRLKAPAACLLVILVISADLWWNARPFWRYTQDYERLHQPDAVTADILENARPLRVLDTVYHGATLMALGIPQLLGHHGFELHRFNQLMGGQYRWPNALSPPMWDLFAVDFLIVRGGPEGLDSVPDYQKVVAGATTAAGDMADLFQRSRPAQYARLVPAAVKLPDAQAIEALGHGRVPLDRLVLLPPETQHVPEAVAALPEPLETEVRFAAWEPGRMVIRIAGGAPAPAYLLVSENWYPDWRASIDGEPAEVLRGNVTLLVVPVPAGAEQVALVFHSDAYERGKLLTWLSAALVAVSLVAPPLARRRSGG